MNTNSQQDTITIYIRRVDRKGMKITLPTNQPITQQGFYHFIINKPQFIKFIQDQLKRINDLDSVQSLRDQQIKGMIELYFQGNLINKQDKYKVIKFRNLSIVHVIIVKKIKIKIKIKENKMIIDQTQLQIKRDIRQKEEYQQQHKQQEHNHSGSQHKPRNNEVQIKAAKIQNNKQTSKQQQIVLNIKILVNNKTCSIINQHEQQQFSQKYISKLMISESRVMKLTQDQLNSKSIYDCLTDINIGEIIKCNNKAQQQNKYELVGYKVKVVHLGRAVEVVFTNKNDNSGVNNNDRQKHKHKQLQQQQQQQQKQQQQQLKNLQQNTKWSQLNVVSHSQIIVMVTKIQLKQTINTIVENKKQQQLNNFGLQIKVDQQQYGVLNHEYSKQQEQGQGQIKLLCNQNNQHQQQHQIVCSQNTNSRRSLYLQLQHVLTLRLYQQQSKRSNKQWKSQWSNKQWKWNNNHNHQHQDNNNNSNNNHLQQKQTNTSNQHNVKSEQNNLLLKVVGIKLSYEFDPFKEQYLFYQNQKNINKVTLQQQIKQQWNVIYDKSHLETYREPINKLQQQSNEIKQQQRQQCSQSPQQRINSQMLNKQTDQMNSLNNKQEEEKKPHPILIY